MSEPVIDPIAGLQAFLRGFSDGHYSGAEIGEALDAMVNTGPLDPIDDPMWAFIGGRLEAAALKLDTDSDGLDLDDIRGIFSRDAAELRAAAERKAALAAKARLAGNDKRADKMEAKAADLAAKADAMEAGE